MNRIVTIEWEHAIELELDHECEGSSGWMIEADTETCEFWGNDDGEDWRVHLTREAA